MLNLNAYINAVKSQIKKERGKKTSQVEQRILNIIREKIEKKEPTTLKAVREALGKDKRTYESYLRLLVSKSDKLQFVKVNGINLIVPKE